MELNFNQTSSLRAHVSRIGYRTYLFTYPCSSQTSCEPFPITVHPGLVHMELWGGDGGAGKGDIEHPDHPGGKGYSRGLIMFENETKLFLYVGAHGEERGLSPTFGGGGIGTSRRVEDGGHGGGLGGGASDIRFIKDDFSSRLIVAAGGGGSEIYVHNTSGGCGGGYSGGEGNLTYSDNNVGTLVKSQGGSQTAGGCDSTGLTTADLGTRGNATSMWRSGGGGGYYGGGAGTWRNSVVATGAGGSSYISGIDGCKTVQNQGVDYQFFWGRTIPGNATDFPSRPHADDLNGQIIISFDLGTIYKTGNDDLAFKSALMMLLYGK